MILKTLTLTDVGVFAGEQSIDFAPASRDQPVTLVGGLNGAGKTTLMRSLFHVLYGAHALPLIERRGSYDRYLEDVTRSDAKIAQIELSFVLQRNAEDEEISIRRSWRRRGGSFVEEVEAFRNGSHDQTLSDGWLDFIESVVPRGVARLVFFDGEKVEALADLENSSTTLRTAVGSLLGLDLVDQLAVDLEVVQRRRATEAATPKEQREIEAMNEDVRVAEKTALERGEELAAFEQDVHVSISDLSRVEEAFRSAGGDFYERRAALLADSEVAKDAVREAETEARTLAVHELAPLLLIDDAVATLAEAARSEQDADELRTARRVVADRDTFVRDLLHDLDAPSELRKTLARRLSDDRAAMDRKLAKLPDGLGLSPVAALLDELASRELASYDRRRTEAIETIDESQARLDHVERLAAQIPTDDAVRMLELARSEAADRVALVRAKTDAAASARDDAERALARARADRERFAKRLAAEQLERLDSERLVQHAEKARGTLALLRERAAARNVDRIAELAVEALEQLLRKDRLIAEMSIDPKSFAPSFRDRQGREIHPEQLSAGERQLTALALLWALARASGRPLPVLIDTPLGRLDSAHRQHVVARYLPMASQQVIVLSTDTEIEASLLEHLQPFLGASYTLTFNGEDDATTITPGYLDVEVPA
ncbi:MAG: DNA sulfur modification protein DndD [Solirubrobacteraceae bacterium MAG38_C4-C5]|nr:DNA sulfur modification protein DndD [Candidatus Siliceabacter maunaloa]